VASLAAARTGITRADRIDRSASQRIASLARHSIGSFEPREAGAAVPSVLARPVRCCHVRALPRR
jgi:hypothetical protein